MTLTCDAIKIAYRQSKDGFVVSFAIHPQDIPADLANAAIGSQWQLRLVELDNDGNPSDAGETSPAREEAVKVCADRPSRPRPFASLPLPQQAGMLSQDPIFWAFLNEEGGYDITTADLAAEALRDACKVSSRAQLALGTASGEMFVTLREQFQAWRLVGA